MSVSTTNIGFYPQVLVEIDFTYVTPSGEEKPEHTTLVVEEPFWVAKAEQVLEELGSIYEGFRERGVHHEPYPTLTVS